MVFDPAKADGIGNNIVDVYSRAELYLIRVIRDALIKAGESPRWAEAELLAIKQQRGRIQGIAAQLQKMAPSLFEDVTAQAFLRGQVEAEKELVNIPQLDPPSTIINDDAVYMLAAEQIGVMSQVHKSILRRTDDIWRAITAEAVGYSLTGAMTTFEAAQRAFTRMARDGLGFFQDAAGRKWGLDTYAEMAVRTATMQALRAGHSETLQQWGVDLVVVSSHKNPAPQCQPYERKILSLTGKYPAGTHRINDNIVSVKATMRDAEARGLHHPHCRHSHSAYVPGHTRIDLREEPYDDSGYKATQKQRYYERQIRASKRMEAAAISDADKQAARQRIRTYQAKLRDHVEKNDLPRRRHREQLRKPTSDNPTKLTKNTPTPKTPSATKPKAGVRRALPKPVIPDTPTPAPVTPVRRNRHGGQGTSVADILARNGKKMPEPLADKPPKKRTTKKKPTVSPEMQAALDAKKQRAKHPLDHVDVLLPRPKLVEPAPKVKLEDIPQTAATDWVSISKQSNDRHGTHNCIRVTTAVEMRRRGYDVTPGASPFRPNPDGRIADENLAIYEAADKVHQETNTSPRDKSQIVWNTGQLSLATWRTKDGKSRVMWQASKAKSGVPHGMNGATVDRFKRDMPEGASGFVAGAWKKRNGGGAHIWNWVKMDGEIRFFEAQSPRGFFDNEFYMSRLQPGSLLMARVDDLVPTEDTIRILDL